MARSRGGSGRSGKERLIRLVVVAAVVAALVFAVQGGEYGTTDLMRQKRRRASLLRTNESLQRAIDSLKQYKRRLETDPALQERIAREDFGMVRGNKELLYRFAEPGVSDSLQRAP
jgi:cell division protein FtsB